MGRRSSSCSVTCEASPVEARNFLARRARMVGVYVSGTVKVMSLPAIAVDSLVDKLQSPEQIGRE